MSIKIYYFFKDVPISNQTRDNVEKQERNLTVIRENATHSGRKTAEYVTTVFNAIKTSFDEHQQGKPFKKCIMLCPVF